MDTILIYWPTAVRLLAAGVLVANALMLLVLGILLHGDLRHGHEATRGVRHVGCAVIVMYGLSVALMFVAWRVATWA